MSIQSQRRPLGADPSWLKQGKREGFPSLKISGFFVVDGVDKFKTVGVDYGLLI